MRMLTSFIFALGVAVAGPAAAQQSVPIQHALKADDGVPIHNFDLTPDLAARLVKLPGQIVVGNPQGDVTLVQFYDLNCPYCRQAAHDMDALVRADGKLKLIYVPYAILSIQSVQGAMVEIAAGKSLNPAQYLDFHRRIYESRGTIDGPRVLAAAKSLGLDQDKLAAEANTEATLKVLRESVDFGMAAKLMATPAYIVGGVIVLGHPGLKPLQDWIGAARRCGKPLCG